MNLMRICFLFIGIIVSIVVCSQSSKPAARDTPKQTMHYFKLGSTIIALKQLQYGNNKEIVMISLHDDETTSVEAAKKALEDMGGVLIKIENRNQRLIAFRLNKRLHKFDPNRIFSRTGIITTLKKNKSYSTLAVKKVQAFAEFILKTIPPKTTTLVAVHNNDEGRLSIYSYVKPGYYAGDVAGISIGVSEDPDNFFLTTDTNIFKRLDSLQYNVVLQENKKARDDGSLSIYYGRRKMSYVNVEVNQGQVEQQSEMIKILFTR